MAVIHRTTLTPSKLELLTSWLPQQPWYLEGGPAPQLTRAGGFRIDDPQGAVGIEFMVVIDASGEQPLAYHVPLTYRGAPLDGADQALVGTTEHGVLGRRWVYDGTHDPVLVAQLFALMTGEAQAQHQSESNTPDPSVIGRFAADRHPAVSGPAAVTHGPQGTEVLVHTTAQAVPATPAGQLTLQVIRVLRPDPAGAPHQAARSLGQLTAGWLLPDGTPARGLFAVVPA